MALPSLNPNLFSAQTILNIIDENRQSHGDDRNGPNVAYIPEGRHTIRWFFDPTGKLFREVMVGRVGKKRFVCPDFLARTDKITNYPTCEIDRVAKEKDQWKDKCRYHCMVYGFLYETKSPSEYWEIGKPYVIIGNSHLKRALLDMLENLQENGMDMLVAMLTPTAKGFFSSVNVTKGQQGHISIQVLTKSVDPVALDDWWVPLADAYIAAEFDEEIYNEAVSEFTAALVAAGDTTVTGDTTSILDEELEEEETITTGKTAVTPATPPNLDVGAVEITPRVAKKTTAAKPVAVAAETKPLLVLELPDDITQEMLPDDCPGWGNYDTSLNACALCEYNLQCMAARDARG